MFKTKHKKFIHMSFLFKEFHGIKYLIPDGFEFLDKNIIEYPSFCGAGKGIGDKIVPEFISNMRCSHICHVHDESWDMARAKYIDFMLGNLVFAYNLFVYLSSVRGGFFRRKLKALCGIAYVTAVSTIGWRIFKNLKGMK